MTGRGRTRGSGDRRGRRPRPGRRPRRAGLGRTRCGAGEPGRSLPPFVGDRLRDVDPVGRDPHVPRHPVGVADLLGELSTRRWRCPGDIAAIWSAIRSWPIADQPATTSASGTGQAPAGAVSAFGARDRVQRLGDVAGGVGVGRAQPVEGRRDLRREQVSRHLGAAAGQGDQQRRGAPPVTTPSSATANPACSCGGHQDQHVVSRRTRSVQRRHARRRRR